MVQDFEKSSPESASNDNGSERSWGLNRRHFLGLGAATAAGAALAACGGSDGGSATSSAATTSGSAPNPTQAIGGEITLWAWGAGLEGEKIQERIEYFNSIYPDVTVNWEPLQRNGYEEYSNLLARFAAGNPPDVMRVLNFQPTQLVAEGGALAALDDWIAADPSIDMADFLEPTIQAAMVDGKMYGMPDNSEPYVIYYNKDAFRAAGLPDPKDLFAAGTWDQASFDTALDALMTDGGMRFGLVFESWTYDNECFMGGGSVLSPDLTPTINTGASPQMLQYFADLVKNGKAPSPVVGGGAQLEAFKTGQAGMYLMGPWWYGALEGQTAFEFSVTGLPSFNGVRAGKIEAGSLSIASASSNPEAAWAFVKTVTDTQGQNIWSAVATPTRRTSLQDSGFYDTPWKQDVMKMVEAGTWTPFTTAGAGVDSAAGAALDPLWAGQQSAQQATDEAAKRITEVLNG